MRVNIFKSVKASSLDESPEKVETSESRKGKPCKKPKGDGVS